MPKIKLGNFSKRKNSTKQPVITTWTEYECSFKKPTSARNPVVELATNIHSYDYAYIDDFNRYYYVTDVISLHNGLTQYALACDSMASHKTEIGSTPARIAFSSTGYDKWLPDPRICVSTDNVYFDQSTANSGFKGNEDHYIVVTNSLDGINYYFMDFANLVYLMINLNDVSLAAQFRNLFSNPFDAVLNCFWLPYDLSPASVLGSVQNVKVGAWTLDGSGGTTATSGKSLLPQYIDISNGQYTTVSVDIPYKWQDFRDITPYVNAWLYLPGVGQIDINLSDFIDSQHVNINAKMDVWTGDVIYRIMNDNAHVVKTIGFSAAANIPLSATAVNTRGALSALSGVASYGAVAAGAIAAGASVAGPALGLIASAAGVALNSTARSASIKGDYTGRSDFADPNYTLTIMVKDTEDPTSASYIAQKGRPVCETHAISNHSGYVQCDDASVIMSGYDWERDEINGYLNSGFFYE